MRQEILLLENNAYFRDNWRLFLHRRFPEAVILEAATFDECISIFRKFTPHLLLMNLSHPNGYDAGQLRRIRRKNPAAVIMLLMDYGIDEYRKDALLNGADYLLSKDLWTGNEILELIRSVFAEVRGHHDDSPATRPADGPPLTQLFERRDTGKKSRQSEKRYLAENPDRRKGRGG